MPGAGEGEGGAGLEGPEDWRLSAHTPGFLQALSGINDPICACGSRCGGGCSGHWAGRRPKMGHR